VTTEPEPREVSIHRGGVGAAHRPQQEAPSSASYPGRHEDVPGESEVAEPCVQEYPERIRIVGGPWPERIGSMGHIVPDPGDGIYPFDKPLRGEVCVLLDDDPLGWTRDYAWTCVIGSKDVEYPERRSER